MHYAAFQSVDSPADFLDTIGLVLDQGFEVVELSSMLGRDRLERASELIKARGGTLFLSAGPEFVRTPRSLCDLRTDVRVATIQRAQELIELARSLGAANLMLVSGADPGMGDRVKARAALADSLRQIVEYARARPGPRLTLETFARERPPGQLLGPTTETLTLLDELGAGEVGVTVDLSHLVQLGENAETAATLLARRSTHVHLSTCVLASGHPLDGDQHPSFDEPGITLSLDAAAVALRAFAGTDAVVSVEIRRHHDELPDAFTRTCARYWRSAVGKPLRAQDEAHFAP